MNDKKPLMRIDTKNRTKLETVIPLNTPFVLFIDPSDMCNFRCSFCPTSDRKLMKEVKRPLKSMNFELFKKIIDDLDEFENPIKVVRLYKDGEPLLNPNFSKMIKYAKESKKVLKIDTTSNASLLNKELSLEMIEAGLDRINISVEGVNSEQYKNFSKYNIDFEKFVENIAFFYEHKKQCEVVVKICGDTLTQKQKDFFIKTFEPISDGAYTEHIMSCWPEFELKDGLKQNENYGIYGQEIKEVLVCPYVFYSMSINSDGKVSVCYLDWAKKMIIGDVNTQSVKDVWLGNTMKEYQRMFLKGDRKTHPICKNCAQLSHGMPDDIDKFANQLIEKI